MVEEEPDDGEVKSLKPPQKIALPDGSSAYQHQYGVALSVALSELHLEFFCFKNSVGRGRFYHFQRICKILFPDLIWHEWLEDQIRSLCEDERAIRRIGDSTRRHVTWAGCGAAGKTYAAALYAFVWFLAAPLESIVILTSTSAKMVRKRIWEPIRKFYYQVTDGIGTCGNLVDSKTTLQSINPESSAKKGSDLYAIFAMAVGEGETNKAAANIQGMHATRIFVVIDEATDVQEAILVAKENLKKGCKDFTELYVGNAKSRLDPLGRAMEPKAGWNSISVESEEWETNEGLCLHFDGYKSPNVKAKRTLFPFLYSYEDYQAAINEGRQNDVAFWMYERGFPPPDGIQNVVIPETLMEQCGGRGTHTFKSRMQWIGGVDPAFGGDACVLRLGTMGDVEIDGREKTGIQLMDRIPIKGDATSKIPLDRQIALKVIEICKGKGMQPEHLGTDATGIGRGVYAFLVQEWGPVQKVDFGGSASEMPASEADLRAGKEVYDRRVTELWFTVRKFLEAGQLKGFDVPTIKEFATRQYEMKNKRFALETKDDFKSRMRHSPDDSDAVAVLIEVARQNGASAMGKIAEKADVAWERNAKRFNDVYVNEAAEEREELFGWMQ